MSQRTCPRDSNHREEYVCVEHGDDHVLYEDDEEGFEGDPEDVAFSADLVDGSAGGYDVVGADEVAEGARGVLARKDGDGVDAEELGCLDVHAGEHDVGAKAGAGDEGTEGADEDCSCRVGGTCKAGDCFCDCGHHAGGLGLHDVGKAQKAPHGDHDGHQGFCRLLNDFFHLAEVHSEGEGAKEGAQEDDGVDPGDVAEEAHHGEAFFREECRDAVPDKRDQHEHVDVRGQCLEGVIFSLNGALLHIAVLFRCVDGHEFDEDDGQDDGDDAGSEGCDLRSDEVGEEEHHEAAGDARIQQVVHDAFEGLGAEGDDDCHEGDDQKAKGVDSSDHRGVEGCGGDSRCHEGRAAADRGKARTAPGCAGAVAQERYSDRNDRIKAEGCQEGRYQSSRCAGSRSSFQEDRHEDTDDDELDSAVISGDLGDRSLYVFHRAGVLERVQDREGAEDHDDDLEAFLKALPQIGVENLDVIRKRKPGDVEVGQCQEHAPKECKGRHLGG